MDAVLTASAITMIKISYAVVAFVVVIAMKLLVKALKVEKANKEWDVKKAA